LEKLSANSTNIFTPTHTEKYLARHRQTHNLTMTEYFTVYRLSEEQDGDDEFLELGEEFYGYRNCETIGQQEETILDERINKVIPTACTDNYGMRYQRRARNKIALWRTNFYDISAGGTILLPIGNAALPNCSNQPCQSRK
jgi:hypothetical protein